MKRAFLIVFFLGWFVSSTAHAIVIGPIAGSWDGTEDTQTNRLFRDGVASTCAAPKAFPGTFTSGTQLYETFSFLNAGPEDCVTIDVTVSSADTHFSVYLGSYDPTNLALNYLGDIGSSESQAFSVVVPGFSQFVVVANTNFGGDSALGQTFSFTVEGDSVTTSVPEPTSLILFGIALAGLGLSRRRIAS